MKTSFLVFCLLLLTINYSSSTFEYNCEISTNPTEKKDCTSLNSDSYPDDYCCLVEAKSGNQEAKYCDAITKDEYNKIKDYVKAQKEYYKSQGTELSKFKIHCQSVFLNIGLVSLIIGLLF